MFSLGKSVKMSATLDHVFVVFQYTKEAGPGLLEYITNNLQGSVRAVGKNLLFASLPNWKQVSSLGVQLCQPVCVSVLM